MEDTSNCRSRGRRWPKHKNLTGDVWVQAPLPWCTEYAGSFPVGEPRAGGILSSTDGWNSERPVRTAPTVRGPHVESGDVWSIVILPTSTDSLTRDAPQIQIEVSSLHDSAVAWAEAGYPVKFLEPGTKRPVVRGGGTRDLRTIDLKCAKYPDAGLGINLDGSGLVVLDIDGPEGEVSLARLVEQAGVELPETYRVTSGRGRHLYLRLPECCPPLVTQYGSQRQRPMLDIKFSGLMVVPPTLHKSGRRYQGSRDQPPRPPDLPEMPQALYDILAQAGRPKAPPRPRRKAAARLKTPLAAVLPGVSPSREAPEIVSALLADTSHGRDGRIFKAVYRMVVLEYQDAAIISVVLASPVAGRASKGGVNPLVYLAHKIRSARDYVDLPFDPEWDAVAFWTAVQAAGLTSSQTRILDSLLFHGSAVGVVRRGTGRIALDCALDEGTTATAVRSLIEAGWLCILAEYDRKTMKPKTYGLVGPWKRQIWGVDNQRPPAPAAPPPRWLSYPPNLRFFTGHDAFRPRSKTGVPTLHHAYPVLSLLGRQPVRTSELVAFTRSSPDTVQRALKLLRDAGILTRQSGIHTFTTQSLSRLLDDRAVACGTTGEGARALAEYRRRAREAAEYREDMAVPGTEAWKKTKTSSYRGLLDDPFWAEVIDEWERAGGTRAGLAEFHTQQELEHINRSYPLDYLEGTF